ncbi:MAG: hypothetical protein AAFQ79_09220 [Pseudomonadota bacterium]
MASITDLSRTPRFGFLNRATDAVQDFFGSVARATAAAEEYDYLSQLSDRQLADRNLDRTTIGRHVMDKHLKT